MRRYASYASNLAGALLVILLCARSAFAELDDTCSDGCPISADSEVVCASDGRTYSSECLARCQGLQVVATGRCLGRPGLLLKESGDAVLTPEDMGRYADQGFRLLGPANVRQFDPEQSVKKALQATSAPPPSKLAAVQLLAAFKALQASGPNVLSNAVMYTSDGLVYAGAPQATPGTNSSASAPTASQNTTAVPQPSGHRKLAGVFGSDDRREITYSAGYPYSAIGYLQSSASNGRCCSACTAFVIGRRAIMTAAHCVFDRDTNSWQKDFVFYPARYSGNRYPYGSFGWTNVYTFTGYTNPRNTNPWPYDIAVIRLSGSGTTLGDRTGWFGLATHNGFNTLLNTAGYPGDKYSGSYWWTNCIVEDRNGNDGQITHYCDTYNGQSGSPMWTSSDRVVRGVVSFTRSDSANRPILNGAAEVTPSTIGSILEWR